jgi:hypothetical protein
MADIPYFFTVFSVDQRWFYDSSESSLSHTAPPDGEFPFPHCTTWRRVPFPTLHHLTESSLSHTAPPAGEFPFPHCTTWRRVPFPTLHHLTESSLSHTASQSPINCSNFSRINFRMLHFSSCGILHTPRILSNWNVNLNRLLHHV